MFARVLFSFALAIFVVLADGSDDIGFIAEEVVDVDPVLGQHGTSGNLVGVKYDRMAALLTKGVQELNAKVDGLAAKVQATDSVGPDIPADVDSGVYFGSQQIFNAVMVIAFCGLAVYARATRRSR